MTPDHSYVNVNSASLTKGATLESSVTGSILTDCKNNVTNLKENITESIETHVWQLDMRNSTEVPYFRTSNQIFPGRSLPDRWSRGRKTLGTRLLNYLVIKLWGCAVESDLNISAQAIPTGGHSILNKVQRLLRLVHWRRVTAIVSCASTRRLKHKRYITLVLIQV